MPIIQRIVHNLLKPHLIPYKLINKLNFIYKKNNYEKTFFEKHQNEIFRKLNLAREKGLDKLLELKQQYNFLDREMSSEHEVLFSSLSLLSKKKFNKILEIGTFDGVNSFLLSLLFEDSQIKTIDLKSDESDFENYYNRKGNVSEFINSRNKIISKSSNINFKELNSIKLCNLSEKFDLIWIDGAHGYPMVCIDIINSLKLIDQGGLIMCDDIYKKKVNSDKMYNSVAAFETLVELKKENIIDLELIYKRLDVENNCDEKNRKFVAIFKKLKTNF